MNPKCYCSQARNGGPASPEKIPAKVVGPLSAAALLELASVGGVGAGDLLLMEGTDVHITLEQFLQMTRSGSPPGGAAAVPVAPPCPPPAPTADNAVPNWLADVRQLEWAPNTKVP